MRDDPTVVALVARARKGDQSAWDEIVDRYAPMVYGICVRYRLDRQEVEDAGQMVWLRLVENIGTLREPAALPGWLGTTTERECQHRLRVTRRHDHAELPPADQMPPDPDAVPVEEEILAAERGAALRAAFAELPRRCRELLSMLISDPPRSYKDISAALSMPEGTIGPTRRRYLRRLRNSPHVTAIWPIDTADSDDDNPDIRADGTGAGDDDGPDMQERGECGG
jgi:RNA polymerase sigma factor (sigma-70 family)